MVNRISIILLSLSLFYSHPAVCQTNELSEHGYGVIEELDVRVSMRDGVRLSTNIYRPDAPGQFPVLLMRSPYGNGGTGNKHAAHMVSRGYAVILQDTRGRYESEGIFDAMQPEAEDGYDTQQWIARQPWFNGKIGTFGGSYVGFTLPYYNVPGSHICRSS
jgi:putative CocE/NonD family hydrolase